jgi:hypothetical protein
MHRNITVTVTKNNTNRVGVNKTFCDASSRTEYLKRVLRLSQVKVETKRGPDLNMVHHRIQKMRHSGGSLRPLLSS